MIVVKTSSSQISDAKASSHFFFPGTILLQFAVYDGLESNEKNPEMSLKPERRGHCPLPLYSAHVPLNYRFIILMSTSISFILVIIVFGSARPYLLLRFYRAQFVPPFTFPCRRM